MEGKLAVQENATPALPAIKFQLLPKGVNPIAIAPPEEADDLADIHARSQIMRASGKLGRFVMLDTEPAVEFSKIEGLVLSKVSAQMLFVAKEKSPHYAQLGGKLFENFNKWICKNSNTLKGTPRLHPELTEEQRQRALQLGAGKSCATCPLGKWNNATRTKPACNAQLNLLWLDAEMQEPVLLQVGSSTSVPPLKNYLGSAFKKNGVALRLYEYTTRLAWEHVKDGPDKDYYVLKAALGPQTPDEQINDLAQLRASLVAEMDALIEEASDISVEDHQEEGGEPRADSPRPAGNGTPEPPATQETFFDNDLGIPMEDSGPAVHVPF